MRRALGFFLALLAAARGAPGRADTPTDLASRAYEVVAVTGEVLVWRPFHVAWQPLRVRDRVRGGTLVQAAGAARLVLNRLDQPTHHDSLTLDMPDAIMLRIQEPLARDIRVSSLSLHGKLGLPSGHGLALGRAPPHGLAMAWQRFRSIGDILEDIPDDFTGTLNARPPPRSIAVDLAPGTIDLRSPSDGSFFFVDRLPAAIPVAWAVKEDPRRSGPGRTHFYQIFEHRRDEEATAKLTTRGSSAALRIDRPGVHFVKVGCADCDLISQEVMVTVEAQ